MKSTIEWIYIKDSESKQGKRDQALETSSYLELPDHLEFISAPPEIPHWANIKLMEEM